MMKHIFLILIACFVIQTDTSAQILDKIKRKAKQRKERKENEAIDEGLDAVEDLFKKKPTEDKGKDAKDTAKTNPTKEPNVRQTSNNGSDDITETDQQTDENAQINVWTERYDFKPGKDIIFFDDFEDEEVSEIPSKWQYYKGVMEVVEVNNEYNNVMSGDLGYGHPNWEENYRLPERYTIEFDVFMADPRVENHGFGSYGYSLEFKQDSYRKGVGKIALTFGKMSVSGIAESTVPGTRPEDFYNTWNHISISVNGNSVKGYYNQYRMFNVRLANGARPNLFAIWNCCLDNTAPPVFLIDNFKVAAGAHPKYKEEIVKGKIVTHNILFDHNSANLLPRSYAEIKRIASILEADANLKLSVEGHTDGDGDEAYNQKLSEQRAESVKKALIDMGINADRLQSKGHGESVPIADNSSPEGKAQNRRVEFVKI